MLTLSLSIIFLILVVYAAASDLLTMTIPNWVSLATIGLFFVLTIITGMPLSDISYHLLAGAIAFVILFGFFAAGWMGGGDVKFATAIVLWFGFSPVSLEFMQYTAVYGGLLTLALLIFRRFFSIPAFALTQEWVVRLHDRKTGVPYGVALAAAALQVFPQSVWFNLLAAGN